MNFFKQPALFNFLLYAIAFLIPVHNNIVPPFIIALTITWTFSSGFSYRIKKVFMNQKFYVSTLLFFLYLAGLSYSNNLNFGFNDIILKLPLLVFPLIIFSSAENLFHTEKANTFFVWGCCIACIFLLVKATCDYLLYDKMNFFYDQLSFLMHPSYLSMYLNFAVSLVFMKLFDSKISISSFEKLFLWFCIALFSCFIILVSSKAGTITLLLLICLMTFQIFRKKSILLAACFFIGLLMLITISFSYVIKHHGNRFDLYEVLTSDINVRTTEGTPLRILVFKESVKVIQHNFLFGVGTGDVKDVLVNNYAAAGIISAENEKLNPHNQFLQTTIALGVWGFIALGGMLLIPLYFGIKLKHLNAVFFVLIISVNMLTESILERQAGMVFVAFFYPLILLNFPPVILPFFRPKTNAGI